MAYTLQACSRSHSHKTTWYLICRQSELYQPNLDAWHMSVVVCDQSNLTSCATTRQSSIWSASALAPAALSHGSAFGNIAACNPVGLLSYSGCAVTTQAQPHRVHGMDIQLQLVPNLFNLMSMSRLYLYKGDEQFAHHE